MPRKIGVRERGERHGANLAVRANAAGGRTPPRPGQRTKEEVTVEKTEAGGATEKKASAVPGNCAKIASNANANPMLGIFRTNRGEARHISQGSLLTLFVTLFVAPLGVATQKLT